MQMMAVERRQARVFTIIKLPNPRKPNPKVQNRKVPSNKDKKKVSASTSTSANIPIET